MPEGPLLNGSADSSFADAPSKKSTLGQVYWFLGALIDWKSKTSTRVLDSSTDAECCSLVMFGKENSWLRDLLKELGIFMVNKPTPVQEDNTAAIALSGQGPTKRSRHYDISFYKFKEQVELNEMALEYVNTHEKPADFFTKPLAKTKFEYFRDLIMGGSKRTRSGHGGLAVLGGCEKGSPVSTVHPCLVSPYPHPVHGLRSMGGELSSVSKV